MNQNLEQARVIDPILTTVVQGYKQAGLAGEELFPRVQVAQSGGKILSFGKEAFMAYNSERAPGSAVKRISFGYQGKPYALENHALESPVPRELARDASAVPGIDLGKRAADLTMRAILLELERAQAKLATDPDNYDSKHRAASAKWSAPDSDPAGDIEDAKEEIRRTVGVRPNVLLLSPDAYSTLKFHPALMERFKYTTSAVIDTAMLAALFGVPKVVVGEAVTADAKGRFCDAWGNNAVLAYVPPVPSTAEEPSYGYTYVMEGHPLVEEAYYDKTHKSWIYGVAFERAPVIAGMEAGFLFQDVK